MKKSIFGSVFFTLTSLSAVSQAAANDPENDLAVTVTVDLTTDYVFRGVSLADSAVQPGVELSFNGAYWGAWLSTGVGDTSFLAGDEVDLYAGYAMSLTDNITLDAGLTYYHYPQGGKLFETEDGAGSYEVFVGLSLDAPASPSATAYYDLTLEALTLEGALGHTLPLGQSLGLDLGITAGVVDGDGFSYEYGQASAGLTYALKEGLSAYVSGNLALSSEDTLSYEKIIDSGFTEGQDSLFFMGAGLSAEF